MFFCISFPCSPPSLCHLCLAHIHTQLLPPCGVGFFKPPNITFPGTAAMFMFKVTVRVSAVLLIHPWLVPIRRRWRLKTPLIPLCIQGLSPSRREDSWRNSQVQERLVDLSSEHLYTITHLKIFLILNKMLSVC